MSSIVTCEGCGTRNRVPAVASGLPQCAKCGRKLPWLVHATDADFDTVVASKVPVLVDLWADWCQPCHMVAPILERLAVEKAGSLKIVKVDVEANPRTQARFGVQSIPTLLLLRDGQEVDRRAGALPKAQLEHWLSSNGVRW